MFDIKAAIEAGERIAKAEAEVTLGEDGVVIQNGRPLATVMEIIDQRAAAPRRLKGTATFAELEGFIEHVNRFKVGGSVVFADVAHVRLTAVLNYHYATQPHWGDHRSVYACPLSDAWKRWAEKDGKAFTQDDFGAFVEENAADLAGPEGEDLATPAKLLETARNLIVRTKGSFERVVNPNTGEFSLVNKLENESTSTRIPRGFVLGIPVFEAGAPYRVEARLRFALRDQKATFSYQLVQPVAILRHAFGEVRTRVAEATTLPVWAGLPE